MSYKSIATTFCLVFFLLLPLVLSRNHTVTRTGAPTIHHITYRHGDSEVIVDNGMIRVRFSSPQGLIKGITYKDVENMLNPRLRNRGYWDITWQGENIPLRIDRVEGTEFKIITQNEEQVEISFSKMWDLSLRGSHVPLNVEKRYIISNNSSGIYTYGILERLPEWPQVDMGQIRVTFKLNPNRFHYMVVSDERQREMPSDMDRDIKNGGAKSLAYKEAVLLTNPHNPRFRHEVDDKYFYSCEVKDNKVHGWISNTSLVGFWIISPSVEYRSGGPIKQELTSHVGPTSISTFISQHYIGSDMKTMFTVGEAWKKVLGPVFIYMNSVSHEEDPHNLWKDAKRQTQEEVDSWPYDFVASTEFTSRWERGTVTGQLLVNDGFEMPARLAHVGLASPGEVGSWQTNAKGYQFWTESNDTGYFTIENVRPGTYNLYGWVPGVIGDYKYQEYVVVTPGSDIKLGRIVYEPPRNGMTMWEIGIPDRTAREFFVPRPYDNMINLLYINHTDKFRQYGLWQRYADLYPNQDLIYKVGSSDYSNDWFYAHVTRRVANWTYVTTTWQIVFDVPHVNLKGNYTLQLALASASQAVLQVRFNEEHSLPFFSTGYIGRDNAIARHGIHGMYRLYSIDVPGMLLRNGSNTIYLRQAKAEGPFQGLMYDYIRLEEPPQTCMS